MRLVTINSAALKGYLADKEMLRKSSRPCALIVHLKYKGKRYDFAVPIRSNISPASPRNEFFPLPPRPSTKPKHYHGIHYIKMFPVRRAYTFEFRTQGNMAATLMKAIIDKNEKQIVNECQQYLTDYENGKRSPYSTNIDFLINRIILTNCNRFDGTRFSSNEKR